MNRKQQTFVLTTTINNRKHYVFKDTVPAENFRRRIARYTVNKSEAMHFKTKGLAMDFASIIKNPFEYEFTPEPFEEEQVLHTTKTNTQREAVPA